MEQKKRFIVSVTYYALFALLIYGGVKYALPVLMPFLLASGVVVLLRCPARKLAGRAPGSERLWTFLLLAAFYLLLFGFVLLAGVRVVSGAGTFFQNLPELYRTTLLPALDRFFDWVGERMAQFDPALVSAVESFFAEMSLSLNQTVSTVSSVAFNAISNFFMGMPSLIVNTVLMVVSSFYLAADYQRVTSAIIRFLPDRWGRTLREVRGKLTRSLGIYARSYVLIFFITWREVLVGLFLLRIPYKLLISLLIALCDILPVLGTGTVLIPWALIAALLGNYPMAAGVGVLYLAITIIRNVIEPRLVGAQIGLHPLLTLISMIVGAHLFGILGLFGLPVTLSIYSQLRQGQGGTPDGSGSDSHET